MVQFAINLNIAVTRKEAQIFCVIDLRGYIMKLVLLILIATMGMANADDQVTATHEPEPVQQSAPETEGASFGSFFSGVKSAVGSVAAAALKVGNEIKTQADSIQAKVDPVEKRTRIRDTALKDIFKNNQYGDWPRVAIKVNAVPKDFYTNVSGWSDIPRTDCIVVTATIWHSLTSSEAINNLAVCKDDFVENVAYISVMFWMTSSYMAKKNTGNIRTNGPVPPLTPFPQSPGIPPSINRPLFFYGSIMMVMGYNWETPDGRFWIVDAPTTMDLGKL